MQQEEFHRDRNNIYLGDFSDEQRDQLNNLTEWWEFRNVGDGYWIRHHEYPFEERPYRWFWRIVWHIRYKKMMQALSWTLIGLLALDLFSWFVLHIPGQIQVVLLLVSAVLAGFVLENNSDNRIAYDRKMQEVKDAEKHY